MTYSNKKKGNTETTYYRCRRSGKIEIKKTARKRDVKGVVTVKTDTECASHLVLVVKDGKHKVSFCSTHTSHTVEPEFLRVSNAAKRKLEAKLSDGVPINSILRSIRAETDPAFKLANLICKKDVENLIVSRNIGRHYRLERDDARSVEEFVQKDNGNSVILYKPVGKTDTRYDKMEIKDFGLAIMNDQQKAALLKLMASPTAILCADATHGTNAYDIKLLTLMTVNSFGNGVPVAFFFCNKEDQNVLGYFFTAIKSAVGNLDPKVCNFNLCFFF